MTDDVWVHLPPLPPIVKKMAVSPQAGSSPWRRSFALDLATRDGGDASGVFRRAEAYLAWLAGEGGGESEALGHPGATNGPDVGAGKGTPETAPQIGAEHTVPGEEAACVNPEMTPERYDAELDAWWAGRKTERKGTSDADE